MHGGGAAATSTTSSGGGVLVGGGMAAIVDELADRGSDLLFAVPKKGRLYETCTKVRRGIGPREGPRAPSR